jgi:hypothetical protein
MEQAVVLEVYSAVQETAEHSVDMTAAITLPVLHAQV